MKPGISYLTVVAQAKRMGFVQINQFDQHPAALRYRRAVYRAVKAGLLKREKSPPSRATYRTVEAPAERVTA